MLTLGKRAFIFTKEFSTFREEARNRVRRARRTRRNSYSTCAALGEFYGLRERENGSGRERKKGLEITARVKTQNAPLLSLYSRKWILSRVIFTFYGKREKSKVGRPPAPDESGLGKKSPSLLLEKLPAKFLCFKGTALLYSLALMKSPRFEKGSKAAARSGVYIYLRKRYNLFR